MRKGEETPQRPPQQQEDRPGHTEPMQPQPVTEDESYVGSGKLAGKVALITGGDSGIGRAVAMMFAQEGADIAIVYLDEHEDAKAARTQVGQPVEVAPCYVFLASKDASYMTGQVLHPNGGEVING
jgi:NAD(P)-dependent dehydrogenase (short-subunit alcohol dehydrogenase family)